MSDEIEVVDGVASFFSVKETAWHKRGHVIQNAPTIEVGLKLAGLNWTVSKHKMFANCTRLGDDGNSTFTRIPAETEMVIRDSDGKRLGEVGPQWKPLQNQDAFEWFDPFLKSGSATLETAGSLFEGRRIFILAKLSMEDSVIVPKVDDRIRKYVLLSNGHDGKLAIRVGFTPIRVVCANTLAMSHGDKASALMRVKHTAKAADTLVKVREAMNLANQAFEATADQYRALAKMDIKTEDLKKYINLVFKKETAEEEELPSAPSDRERSIKEDDGRLIENKIMPLFEEGPGAELPGVRGTLWSAYNSITYFLSYMRGRTQDERLNQLWFSSSLKTNKKALDIGFKIASGKLNLATV